MDGIGCLTVYVDYTHSIQTGMTHCTNLGGDIFEFYDFQSQNEILLDYLKTKGGTTSVRLFLEISSPFFLVQSSNSYKNDIWLGLEKNSDGNFYWRRSRKQLKHEGTEKSSAWRSGHPETNKDCVFSYVGPTSLENNFMSAICATTRWEVTPCEVTYDNLN